MVVTGEECGASGKIYPGSGSTVFQERLIMLKGISVWAFAPQRPLPEVFALARDTGFEAVEVAIAEDGPLTPHSTESDCRRIVEQAAHAGITICGLASGLGWKYPLTSTDNTIRERGIEITKASLHAAKWLGTDAILLVPGIVDEETSYETAWYNATQCIYECQYDANELGITIGIENVWNKFLLSPMEMKSFINEFDFGIGAYFDVGNVLAFGYPEQWIETLGNFIRRVHFKDFKRSIGNINGFCPLLEGDVNFFVVMQALREIGYDGPVVSEFSNCEEQLPAISAAMDKILAM